MESKFFFGNKARGLKRALSFLEITKEDLDFEGKIKCLEQDSRIIKINGSILGEKPRRHYKIKLNKSLTRKEILSLITKYGFAKPIDIEDIVITGNEDMKCTEHSLHTKLFFPHPYQRLYFRQPYEIQEPLKTQEL